MSVLCLAFFPPVDDLAVFEFESEEPGEAVTSAESGEGGVLTVGQVSELVFEVALEVFFVA